MSISHQKLPSQLQYTTRHKKPFAINSLRIQGNGGGVLLLPTGVISIITNRERHGGVIVGGENNKTYDLDLSMAKNWAGYLSSTSYPH